MVCEKNIVGNMKFLLISTFGVNLPLTQISHKLNQLELFRVSSLTTAETKQKITLQNITILFSQRQKGKRLYRI